MKPIEFDLNPQQFNEPYLISKVDIFVYKTKSRNLLCLPLNHDICISKTYYRKTGNYKNGPFR